MAGVSRVYRIGRVTQGGIARVEGVVVRAPCGVPSVFGSKERWERWGKVGRILCVWEPLPYDELRVKSEEELKARPECPEGCVSSFIFLFESRI